MTWTWWWIADIAAKSSIVDYLAKLELDFNSSFDILNDPYSPPVSYQFF